MEGYEIGFERTEHKRLMNIPTQILKKEAY
jgi:hypothetical protein